MTPPLPSPADSMLDYQGLAALLPFLSAKPSAGRRPLAKELGPMDGSRAPIMPKPRRFEKVRPCPRKSK